MTTQTAWPVALDGSHSQADGAARAQGDGLRFVDPVTGSSPTSRPGPVDTSAAAPGGPARLPWHVPTAVLLLLVLADTTLAGLLLGRGTWWVVAAVWVASLVMLVRRLRPRLV